MSRKSMAAADKVLGDRIRQARLEAKLSQTAIATVLDVTFQQVQKYEKGINRVSVPTLRLIAQSVGKPVEWFYGDPPAKNREADIIHRFFLAPHAADLARDYLAIKSRDQRAVVEAVAGAMAIASQ